MINFKHINYNEKFHEYYEKNKYFRTSENLYVFQDNRMKDIFYKKLNNGILSDSARFLTFEEFKQNIFLTDKIVLREAKRILAFFKSIPKDIKDELEIKGYFDIIDFANHFFSYYRALNISDNDGILVVQKWQEKHINYFEKIKESFDKFCEKYNYIPSDWVEKYSNFNEKPFLDIKNIIFIDIMEYPNLYKKIIKKLSENYNVIINIQGEKGDFSEEELRLIDLKIPKVQKKPRVYLYENDLQEAINIIDIKKKEKLYMYSPSIEDNKFYDIFPNDFALSLNPLMNDTKLFKFLNIQLALYSHEKLKETYLIKDLITAFDSKVFRDYYDINYSDYKNIVEASNEGYKYISPKIMEEFYFDKNFDENFKSKIKNIIYDMNEINNIKDIATLYRYFVKTINLEKLLEEDYDNTDIMEKFLEIFGIMQTNEDMEMHKNNPEYFGKNVGISLYRLLIQYMKDIVIKSNLYIPEEIVVIKPLDYSKYALGNQEFTNCFVDVIDFYLPKIKKDNLIFTESQRIKLGMISENEEKLLQKHLFYQAITSKENTIIFTCKNEEEGINISPFLEEFIEENDIEIQDLPIKFENNPLFSLFNGENMANTSEDENLLKEENDFKDNKINFGAYDINIIQKCELKYYFDKMKNLKYTRKNKMLALDLRVLGIIVHETLEKIVKNNWKKILNSNTIEINYDEIKQILTNKFKENNIKFERYMDNYIKEIVIPMLIKNIEYLFYVLNKKYIAQKFTRFQGEKIGEEKEAFYKGKINVFLKGRADLVIETQNSKEIIDYKTGGTNDKQLDFYSIILYGESDVAQKQIYNVWKKDFKNINAKLKREDLLEIIKNFSDSDIYNKAEEEKNCHDCMYKNLCKGEK